MPTPRSGLSYTDGPRLHLARRRRPVPQSSSGTTKLYFHDAYSPLSGIPNGTQSTAVPDFTDTDANNTRVMDRNPGNAEANVASGNVIGNSYLRRFAYGPLQPAFLSMFPWFTQLATLKTSGATSVSAKTIIYIWRPSTQTLVARLDNGGHAIGPVGVAKAIGTYTSSWAPGITATIQDGDYLIVEFWSNASVAGADIATLYYDGLHESDATSEAAYIQVPAALQISTTYILYAVPGGFSASSVVSAAESAQAPAIGCAFSAVESTPQFVAQSPASLLTCSAGVSTLAALVPGIAGSVIASSIPSTAEIVLLGSAPQFTASALAASLQGVATPLPATFTASAGVNTIQEIAPTTPGSFTVSIPVTTSPAEVIKLPSAARFTADMATASLASVVQAGGNANFDCPIVVINLRATAEGSFTASSGTSTDFFAASACGNISTSIPPIKVLEIAIETSANSTFSGDASLPGFPLIVQAVPLNVVFSLGTNSIANYATGNGSSTFSGKGNAVGIAYPTPASTTMSAPFGGAYVGTTTPANLVCSIPQAKLISAATAVGSVTMYASASIQVILHSTVGQFTIGATSTVSYTAKAVGSFTADAPGGIQYRYFKFGRVLQEIIPAASSEIEEIVEYKMSLIVLPNGQSFIEVVPASKVEMELIKPNTGLED